MARCIVSGRGPDGRKRSEWLDASSPDGALQQAPERGWTAPEVESSATGAAMLRAGALICLGRTEEGIALAEALSRRANPAAWLHEVEMCELLAEIRGAVDTA